MNSTKSSIKNIKYILFILLTWCTLSSAIARQTQDLISLETLCVKADAQEYTLTGPDTDRKIKTQVFEIIREIKDENILRKKLRRIDVGRLDEFGVTPILFAASIGNWRAIKILLEYGANVNKRVGDFGTPLEMAISAGQYQTVCKLLQFGAKLPKDKTEKENMMRIAISIDFAQQDEGAALVSYLLKNGFDVNSHGSTLETPLMGSIAIENIPAIKVLIAAGAKLDVVKRGKRIGDANRTAWDVAVEKGNPIIMQILREAATKQGFKEPPSASTLEKPAAEPPSVPVPAPLKKRELEPA